jgi:hypothetical protein
VRTVTASAIRDAESAQRMQSGSLTKSVTVLNGTSDPCKEKVGTQRKLGIERRKNSSERMQRAAHQLSLRAVQWRWPMAWHFPIRMLALRFCPAPPVPPVPRLELPPTLRRPFRPSPPRLLSVERSRPWRRSLWCLHVCRCVSIGIYCSMRALEVMKSPRCFTLQKGYLSNVHTCVLSNAEAPLLSHSSV